MGLKYHMKRVVDSIVESYNLLQGGLRFVKTIFLRSQQQRD